jgi:hypothetical protein
MSRAHPTLAAGVTPWRLQRLLDDLVPCAVGRAQGQALRRRMAAEGEPPLEYELVASETISGVTVIAITFPESQRPEQTGTWSADE